MLAKHDNKYLDVCKHYRQVLDTEAVEEDPKKLRAVCYTHPLTFLAVLIRNTDPPTRHLLRHPRSL